MNQNDALQIKERWKNEINLNTQQDMWEEICTEAHLVTKSNLWQKLRPEIMSRMGPTHSCGGQTVGNKLVTIPIYSILGMP